jgi:hypothetical protein
VAASIIGIEKYILLPLGPGLAIGGLEVDGESHRMSDTDVIFIPAQFRGRSMTFLARSVETVRACAVIAEGTGWDFEVREDTDANIVTDLEIRNRCKQSRTP